jgi:cell division transport system permease protein
LKWSHIGFVGRRVRHSLWQLLWNHVLTSGTMATSLFVFGAFMLLQDNLQQLLKGWGDRVQLNAYLDKDLEDSDVQVLLHRVLAYPEVERARHITEEEAWRDFQAALGTQSSLLEGLPRDVLPSSFEIVVKPAYRDVPMIEALAKRLKEEKAITAVDYPQEWVERLSLVVLAVRWAKWIFGGVLFFATFFIVGNTVKLAVLARKEEIEIMQLVGASEDLIQAPFVLEGMIQGIAGALAALLSLWTLLLFLRTQVPESFGLFGPLTRLRFLDLESMIMVLTIGWLLGAAGSLFSLRRFVKTWKVYVGER